MRATTKVAAALVLGAIAASAVTATAQGATPAAWKTYCTVAGGRRAGAHARSRHELAAAHPAGRAGGVLPLHERAGRIPVVDLRGPADAHYPPSRSLAALAYLEKPSAGRIPGNVNPASIYCSRLGGSDQFGGQNLGGGGWIVGRSATTALQACVFPDGSIIDSFGILYHSQGTVRGADLTTRFRYRPSRLPNVFG